MSHGIVEREQEKRKDNAKTQSTLRTGREDRKADAERGTF
jgi:hypothetical protein